MNAFQNYWSPMNAFRGGIDAMDQIDESVARDQERKRQLAKLQGLSDFGQGDALAGYEGVQGAVRPDYLKQLYQTNPEAALQVEQSIASPFAMERDITKAGKIEEAKRRADADVGKNMMAAYFKARREAGMEPQQASSTPAAYSEGGGQPGPGAAPNYAGMSGDESSFEFGPQGFKFGVKSLSDVERATKTHDMRMKDEDLALKKESQVLDKARFNATLTKDEQSMLDGLQTQGIAADKELRELEKAKASGDLPPAAFLQQANSLLQRKKEINAQKEVILRGQQQTRDIADMPASAYRAPESKQARPVTPTITGKSEAPAAQPAPPTQPVRPTKPAAASPEVGAGLPYKMQQEVKQQNAKEKISIANKAIEDAHAAALKSESLNESVGRMSGLVNAGVGSTAMGALPWGMGEAIMSIGHDNKRVQSLNAQLIEMYKTEGQTKAFDTLPELKIVASRIPSLDKSEDQNREDMAGVANLMDARRASGDFLEQWAHTHGGTLDGAREVLRGWIQHSPLYKVQSNNGRVSMEQNPHYIPLDTWTRLRQQFSDRDIVKMRDSNELQIIGGRVFVDR